jgi:hypothetical protein
VVGDGDGGGDRVGAVQAVARGGELAPTVAVTPMGRVTIS